ncbi:phospholipase D family protein [Paenarthrobacter sp. A20]|uniref:phospholipase D family protein n=1 Tax=Paenarthrobacter sp. A20 TaxID=2817891 RepID=UPI00209C9589|nr:phospholipase D family protein [Paenarthrobacter sp. A20]
MLDATNRQALTQQLRPPSGFRLLHAVGTTFTLDMTSALSVPLSFVAGNGEDYTNSVAVLSVLRKVSDRVDIFCQAGHIQAPKDASDLLAMLEPMVHQVSVKRGLFHPKVWVLEFERGTERRYRFLCSSRNLTPDASWDLLVRLDGELEAESENASPDSGPLARFIEKLPELCTVKLDVDRLARVRGLASRVSKVRWELPEGIQKLAFRPMGLGEEFEQGSIAGHLREPSKFRALNGKTGDAAFLGFEKLVISPFLDDALLARLRDPWMRNLHVYSRGDQLDLLQEKTVSERRSSFKSFDERGIVESTSTGQASSDPEGFGNLAEDLSGLHAKAYFCDYDHSTYALLGSANATAAAFGTNVEFLVELRGAKKQMGVQRVIDSLKEVPFEEYGGKGGQEPSDEDQAALSLEKELRAAAAHQFLVEAQPDSLGTFAIEISHSWRSKPQFTATLRLLSLPQVTAAVVPSGGAPIQRFRAVPLADVTPYLLLTLKDPEAQLSKSTVIQGILLADLPGRLDEIVARQLNDPQKLCQFLLLFLTPEDVRIGGAAGANWQSAASASSYVSASGLFEAMVGALASPDSGPVFADLKVVMDRLLALRSDDREILELHSLWTAAVEALKMETPYDV